MSMFDANELEAQAKDAEEAEEDDHTKAERLREAADASREAEKKTEKAKS